MALRKITPLWECGVTFTYFNGETSRFEVCSLENTAAAWGNYKSSQALLAGLMIELYEDELTSVQLQEAARLAGFTQMDRLLQEVESLSPDQYKAWSAAFPSTCEAPQETPDN
ncbi:hypothetical protein KIH07_03130 [Hydrogenophaga taeniospiralis]|uniref:hypothetical protein n=1 Tax=Hydrogenophaga taeniospiralis TaxID=65656 RepID=UPI001CF960F5|nr:hypothetical protein [Hydrogenophaga taeniospiralis]MCB4362709.1 hypothetical protein [Hydrogenophaga taeniospiralis]